MNDVKLSDTNEIVILQQRIKNRLDELHFSDPESGGEIIHHLAEVTCIGRKLAQQTIPEFLAISPSDVGKLADLTVDIKTDLEEMKEAILDMDAALLKLVNFLNA
jgi:hypothetical protein